MKKETVIPIYKGQDFYIPAFEVFVNKARQGKEIVRDIMSVSYKDIIEGYDTFDITINNWDAEKRTFKYSDSNIFDPGKKVEIWMGYHGNLQRMIKGTIQSLQPSFPSGGQPTLKINGRGPKDALRTKQKTVVYEKMTYSEIAQKIGRQLGIKINIDNNAAATEPRQDYLIQQNQYDIIYLMDMAKKMGYELVVEKGEETLYFGRSVTTVNPVYELTYGLSLKEFQPNLNPASQVSEVTVRASDNMRKEKIEYTAKRSQIITRNVSRFEQVYKERKEIITDKPVANMAEAKKLAIETLERIAKKMITGSGSTVGFPGLRAGNVVVLKGLGELFSGRYYLTSATHTIDDSGYVTQFECRREDL
jgi:uncharacterized protein